MILIIDDDKAVRISLALLLKQEGFTTKEVTTSDAALAFVQNNTPELILMDMNFSIQHRVKKDWLYCKKSKR